MVPSRASAGLSLPAGAGGGMVPRGYHLSKPKRSPLGTVGQKLVKNRHMNVLNPHALSRSTRRVKGFVSRATRAMHLLGIGTGSHRSRRGMGHKAGCSCVICRRK